MVRAPTALIEEPGVIPRTHMESPLQPVTGSMVASLGIACTRCMHICIGNKPIHIIKIKVKKIKCS